MAKEVVGVILAGGEGKRFWPLVSNKMLFQFFEKPLVAYSVGKSLPDEIKRLVVVTSKENDNDIKKFKFPIPHTTVIQETPNGMAGALLSAKSQLSGVSLLIINGDDVYDSKIFHTVLEHVHKTHPFGVIPVWTPKHYFPVGYIKPEGDRITDIVEKPGKDHLPSPYAVMLGHFIEDSDVFFQTLEQTKSSADDVYEKTLSTLMKEYTFEKVLYEETFSSLKYPWHVLDVMDVLLKNIPSHRGKNVDIKSNVVIEGNVYIEDDVRIFENTKITGPCYIGKGTIIGNNNIIRYSHIGAHCVTGFSTDITRSYVGNSCWFHTNFIGDSVLEENVSLGSGTVLANLRLDEEEIHSHVKDKKVNSNRTKLGVIIGKNVRIGVNTSVMPGVKIGSETFVGAGIVVFKDVPDNSFVTVKEIQTNARIVPNGNRESFRKKV